jgi:DNA adenine methylase
MAIVRTLSLSDLAAQINAEHEACLSAAKDTIARAIEAGRLLAEAKSQMQHGQWAGWVETNCKFGARQASSYMRAYACREQIGSGASDFTSLREAIASLAEPRPVSDDVDPSPPGPTISESAKIPAKIPSVAERIPSVAERIPSVAALSIASLKAPFPYHGGKRRAAGLVWALLGDVRNYVEPFCGSAAVLLARPHPPQIETVCDPALMTDNFFRATHPDRGDPVAAVDAFYELINDADPYLVNLWRSVREAPEETAAWADNPINQSFVHAVHRYLVLGKDAAKFRERIRRDMDYFDARRAGLWAFGACTWIGSAWCRVRDEGDTVPEKRIPLCCGNTRHGPGVHGRPQLADARSRGRGVHRHDAATTCQERSEFLRDWFNRLRDRLRVVRVTCGDWTAVCSSESVTTRLGTTGIFLDPPYSAESGRTAELYNFDSGTIAHDVRRYCLERGGDPRFRIVLAGYTGEGHEELERHGWRRVAWRSVAGYNGRTEAGRERAQRERLWCSPHSLLDAVDPSLFDDPETTGPDAADA